MTTVSVRVSRELKQQAEELGLNKSEVMRSALTEEVSRRERMAERRTQISTNEVDSSNETITAVIRKSREEDAR